MKIIYLPPGGLGIALFLLIIALIVILPFVSTVWALSLLSVPWWVSGPAAMLASTISFVTLVKFKP